VTGGWLLDGQKRWIGNGTWADVVVVFARSSVDNQVRSYVVQADDQQQGLLQAMSIARFVVGPGVLEVAVGEPPATVLVTKAAQA
jgi:alkylation response protein AidB-like acyl-CoA dehydrogenase